MTLEEMANELADHYGLNLPSENDITKHYRTGKDRAGLVLKLVEEKVTTRLTRMMGPGRVENMAREWMR